ncbi:hypothetical protein BRD15_11140 [Halobacteriales archaeon SW_6_65_15]|nr:MAG: hypothetical protein BRD15_11140 [Halobacteriales archaeon SW_6_65_15]
MTSEADKENSTLLSPDEAFAVLGNETRIQILRVLGRADAPLAFSELYDRIEYDTTANFNYHLDKLVGHFVRRTDEGYALRQTGRRVVQAILSGAVTDDPVVEATEVDFPCRHCGAPVEVSYSRGEMRLSCTECSGNVDISAVRDVDEDVEYGNLANSSLPPAGVQGRTAAGVFRTAATQICDQCDRHYAVLVHFRCTNCIYEEGFPAVMALLNVPELLTFVGEHGLNVTADGIEWGWDFDEEILSTDPFETRFTFTIDGDSITLTVDDGLNVGRVSR